jgi:hypothetical protein
MNAQQFILGGAPSNQSIGKHSSKKKSIQGSNGGGNYYMYKGGDELKLKL